MTNAAGPSHELVAASVDRDVIWVRGDDAAEYLQGQLSQEVAAMSPGESAWSLLLQPRGKVDAWFRITRIEEQVFLLDIDAGYGEATIQRLERFKLRTDCEFVGERWSIVSLRGDGAADLASAAGTGEMPVDAGWPGIEAVDLLAARVELPDGELNIGVDELEGLRIRSGVPAMGRELTEDTIPAEAGIVDRSVSFTKGCYVGQELVARIDSRGGNVPRRLCGVVGSAGFVAGDTVSVDGDEVGLITSVQGGHGLAYVKRSVDVLPASAQAGGSEVEIRDLPMF
ncbi:MAG: YgfZ/GcvT domain-containing protein [Acidimicrobiales bacterium]